MSSNSPAPVGGRVSLPDRSRSPWWELGRRLLAAGANESAGPMREALMSLLLFTPPIYLPVLLAHVPASAGEMPMSCERYGFISGKMPK